MFCSYSRAMLSTSVQSLGGDGALISQSAFFRLVAAEIFTDTDTGNVLTPAGV